MKKNEKEKTKAFTVTVDEEMEAADRAIAGGRNSLCVSVCLEHLSVTGASVVLVDRDVHSTGQTRDENWSP